MHARGQVRCDTHSIRTACWVLHNISVRVVTSIRRLPRTSSMAVNIASMEVKKFHWKWNITSSIQVKTFPWKSLTYMEVRTPPWIGCYFHGSTSTNLLPCLPLPWKYVEITTVQWKWKLLSTSINWMKLPQPRSVEAAKSCHICL